MTAADLQVLEKVAIPLAVAVIALLGVLGGTILGNVAAARERRRTGYADAIACLIAWTEFPYRVRRRAADDAATLQRLADLGHDLHEHVARSATWVAAENVFMGRLYRDAMASLKTETGEALRDAWTRPPVAKPGDMNLGVWGPASCDEILKTLRLGIANRFGWRRALHANAWWYSKPRLPRP